MVCEAHIIAWNEAETIHLSLRHYQQFCSRIILYDNYSDDGTPEIAKSMGCEVKQFGIKGVLDDREYTKLKNNCWKGSKADWVIVVDADEILMDDITMGVMPCNFICDPRKEYTIFNTIGWNVYSHEMAKENLWEITNGFYDQNYSKLCIFNPKEIKEIGYVHGAHVAKPQGNIKFAPDPLLLLHYRNIGGPQRLIDRHALYRPRMSEWNKRWRCGHHYEQSDIERKSEWERLYKQSVNFSPELISGSGQGIAK